MIEDEEEKCWECWEEARARMLHNFGGLMTTKSTYVALVGSNWCESHA